MYTLWVGILHCKPSDPMSAQRPTPPSERLPQVSRGCSPLLRFSGLFARLCAASVPDSAHLRCQKDWRTSYFS